MTSIYSSSSTTSSSLLRITGMATGIDTDSVVKSMVSNYQAKIDKANQAKQTLQWQQEAYRDIIKGIKDLQDYFNPTSSKYILGSNSMNINSASSDASSIVSATAGSTAKAGTYSINVSQLAEQAKIQGNSKDSLISISDFKVATSQKISGDSGTVDLSGLNTSDKDLVADINSKIAASSLKGQVSASYVKEIVNGVSAEYIKFTNTSSDTNIKYIDSRNTGLSINSGISSSTKLASLGVTKGTESINFTLNGTEVKLDVNDSTTIQDLMDKVKSTTSGAVTMSIDDTTGCISFQAKDYGSSSSIELVDSGKTLSGLGVLSGTKSGKDAVVTITEPGKTATTTTQSSNQFSANGISYNLVNQGTSNITVTSDSDKVVENIKSFVTDYNTVISTINTKLTEKKDSDYPPLTDDQREAMSDDQIKNWEAKAKVGILRNDDYLSNLMSQLRGIFSSPVYNSYSTTTNEKGEKSVNSTKLSLNFGNYTTNSIGIDTSSSYTDGGTLEIKDETKLKNVIENNFDDFKKMFTQVSSTPLKNSSGIDEAYIGSDKYKEDGLFIRMNTILKDYVAAPGLGKDGTYTLSGSMNIFVNKQYDYSTSGTSGKNTLPDKVYLQTLSISKLKTQMSDAETRYYAKFTALETAMTKLNSQQSQLSSLLGTS